MTEFVSHAQARRHAWLHEHSDGAQAGQVHRHSISPPDNEVVTPPGDVIPPNTTDTLTTEAPHGL